MQYRFDPSRMISLQALPIRLRAYCRTVVPFSFFFAAPTAVADTWGEPWGSFNWIAALGVPATPVWVLAVVVAAIAFAGGSRFK